MLGNARTHSTFTSLSWTLPLALALVLHTTTYKVFSVPTVHFDEAWQGTFALRIATEPSFWPLEAMNSYTGPALHYLLALAFRVFGVSFETSRGFFATINLVSFGLFSGLILRIRRLPSQTPNLTALVSFAVFYALTPVSVFDQRIQIEVTSWFALCYGVLLWGIVLWPSRRMSATALITLGALLGIWSHILFFTAIISVFGYLLLEHTEALTSPQGRRLALGLNLLLACFPLRMGLALKDPFPFLLACGFLGMAVLPTALASLQSKTAKTQTNFKYWSLGLYWLLGLFALPPALIYLVFNFNGTWPYATITGDLQYFWVPVNIATLLTLGWLWRSEKGDAPSKELRAFLILFTLQLILTGYSVLKATSPKYWMIPTITLCLGMSLLWERSFRVRPKLALGLLGMFAIWNLFTFETALIGRYTKSGARDEVFRVGRFADSPLAHRPTLAVYHWLKQQGCHLNPVRIEIGRLQDSIEYLQKLDSKPGARTPCPWGTSPVVIIQDRHSLAALAALPAEYKVIAESPSWGDLKVAVRARNSSRQTYLKHTISIQNR